MPDRVFAIVAHPDDIEFVMSGTLMRLKEAGYELHYMTIANGCCGSTDMDAATTARIRREESIAAAEFLGATFHESITNDLEIFYDHSTLMTMSSIVRKVRPRILLVHSPQDYMEDHENACRLAVSAAFIRCIPNYPVQPPQPATNQDVAVYHAQPHGNRDPLRNPIVPELVVDVTDLMDRKSEVLSLHASQQKWLDQSQGMNSYVQTMHDLSREVGRLSPRYEYAEGWRRHSHLGFSSEDVDPLYEALADHATYLGSS